ncbi:MAG: hypothetical protein EOM23_09895 [Candidatus Moranbacteria bacterium]|nr:hypothetical protein [Candidatus Moranbacteria bacterium]
MKKIINANKDDKNKLQTLMAQIKSGIDPIANEDISSQVTPHQYSLLPIFALSFSYITYKYC